jgi:hypothetical protein
MTTRKRKATGEPLLNTVARKLGHAAGTFAKATQELTENLSAIRESVTSEHVTAKVRESARAGAPLGRFRARTRHPKKKTRRITRMRAAAGSKSRKLPKGKSPRSERKASSSLNK